MLPAKQDIVEKLNGSLQKLLGGTDYVRIGTIGDGSCFFHAVCYAINHRGYVKKNKKQKQEIAHAFRCNFKNHVTNDRVERFCKNHNICVDNVEEFKKKLCSSKIWAGQDMITWISEVLRKNIVFIDGDTAKIQKGEPQLYCGVRGKGETIIVLWVQKSHFELIGRIHNVGQTHFSLQTEFDPNHQIMKKYNFQCQ